LRVKILSVRNYAMKAKSALQLDLFEPTLSVEGIDIGKDSLSSILQKGGAEYRPCLSCERHPRYQDIPPVTLHVGNKCLICKK
jgi:hypothetical protein